MCPRVYFCISKSNRSYKVTALTDPYAAAIAPISILNFQLENKKTINRITDAMPK
jgi:hypothetical protein